MDIKKLEEKEYNGYKFISRIGNGSFGVVYRAESLKDGKQYAIKVESSRATNSQIYFEYDVYIYMHLCCRQYNYMNPPFLNIHGIHSNKDLTFFVMDLLGPSLHDVFREYDREIPLKKLIDYAKQMVLIIHKIHLMSIIYRDIKPQNFVFTDKSKNRLKLVDFGLAKKTTLPNQKCKVRQTSKVIGTLRYASVRAHEGKVLGRKDDIQSLVYVIIYLMKGSLPWQGMRAKTQNQKDDSVYKMKKSIPAKDLCSQLPTAFQKLVNYVRDQDFFQKDQCYDQIIQYLDEAFEQNTQPIKRFEQNDWWDLQYQMRQQNPILNPYEINVKSPQTVQKKTSSNQATNTCDQNSLKDEVKNLTTPTKKKPIKMPSIKKNFTLNDDSDSEQSPQLQIKRKKSKSNFVEDQIPKQQDNEKDEILSNLTKNKQQYQEI